jgi:hypothetical protein
MAAILHSSLEADVRMASRLGASLTILLADNSDMRQLVPWMGSVNGSLSDTHGMRQVALDADEMVAGTEGSSVSNTTLADSSANIAVVWQALVRDESDLAILTAGMDDVTPDTLAASMVRAYIRRFAGLFADAGDGFSASVGSAGVDMSTTDFFSAVYTLQLADVPAEGVYAVLHPQQFNDFTTSLRSEGGVIEFDQTVGTGDLIRLKGQGFCGNFAGVDIWKSSNVNASGGDRKGWMAGRPAFGWMTGNPLRPRGVAPEAWIVGGEGLAIEFDRDGSAGLTQCIGHGYMGIALVEDAYGIGIDTDQ